MKPHASSHVINYRRPWWRTARSWWPLLVVVFFGWLSVFLSERGGTYHVMGGTVERVFERVAPLESGRVTQVYVEVGDPVKAGDVIAQLDTRILDAEVAALHERMVHSRMQARLNALTLERQFANAVHEAESTLSDAEFAQKYAEVDQGLVEKEIQGMEALFQGPLIEARTLTAMKLRDRALKEQLKIAPGRLAVLKAEVTRAQEQQRHAQELLAAVEVLVSKANEETAVAHLNARKEGYTLRAFQNGTVAERRYQPGEVVPAGESIASLLIDGPRRIIGFLPESNRREIRVGTNARILPSVSLGNSGIISAHVVQISPAVESLPEQLSPIRGQVLRGRRVTFMLDERVDLTPGERVSIELLANEPGPF